MYLPYSCTYIEHTCPDFETKIRTWRWAARSSPFSASSQHPMSLPPSWSQRGPEGSGTAPHGSPSSKPSERFPQQSVSDMLDTLSTSGPIGTSCLIPFHRPRPRLRPTTPPPPCPPCPPVPHPPSRLHYHSLPRHTSSSHSFTPRPSAVCGNVSCPGTQPQSLMRQARGRRRVCGDGRTRFPSACSRR
jgi:hypothetical protein